MSNLKISSESKVKRVYGKKNADERVLERRERLLDAALELFSKQGYANTTIEALCAESKGTTRHFYQLFDGREALLLALYNQMIEELELGLLTAMMTEYQTLNERMEVLIQALVHHYLKDTRRAQIGVIEVVGASELIERRRREVIYKIASHVETFMDALVIQKQLPKRNYHWLAIAIVGGINELMADWLVNRALSLEQLMEEMIFAFNTLFQGIGTDMSL